MTGRTFDSLRQALNAFELCRIWDAQREVYRTRDASIVCMPRDRLDRTRHAADYLYRRVLRAERKAA
jgi:hypothetical protein